MAAGSILNSAVKYVYPDRHIVGGKRTNKLHSGKRQENLVYRSSRCYSYSRNLKECGHQKVVPKHVDNTASDILGPLWSERNLIQFNLVSWRHVCLISGGNYARSDLSVQLSIYRELTSLFFSLLILSIVQAALCDLPSLVVITGYVEDVSNSARHSEFKQYLL